MKFWPIKLILSVLVPLGLGAFAGIFTARAVPLWYATLHQPAFNPPNWIFGPVWSALYLLLGISFFLLWRAPANKQRHQAMTFFGLQMALNFAWSFIFFFFHQIGLAFIEIGALWVSIVLMIRSLYKVNPIAAYINIPYLLWVSFAMVLNAAYYFLN